MVDEVGSRGLGILIDVGHLNAVNESVPNSIVSAEEHLVHVLINDNNGTGDQHLVPGDGNIDFRTTLAALRRIGYDGYLTIELEQKGGDSAAIRSKKFMEELLRERGTE
jgi:sugar phosphate isomerase/epimerase